jgi:hypothetical protein
VPGTGTTEPQTLTTDGLAEYSQPLALWLRRAAVLALAALVVATLLGVLGVRTAETSAHADGYDLTLRYPAVGRAGLDAEWQVTVGREGGLPQEIVLAVTGDYFDLFEAQAFHPEPADSTRDEDTLYLTFTTQPGSDQFVVVFDAYLQPAAQRGSAATVALLDGEHRVVSVDYRTRLLP